MSEAINMEMWLFVESIIGWVELRQAASLVDSIKPAAA